MSHKIEAAGTATDGTMERALDLSFEFAEEILADPSILDEIPNGITLVLIPDDDPELATAKIAGGLTAVRRGEDVLFRHVRRPLSPPTPG